MEPETHYNWSDIASQSPRELVLNGSVLTKQMEEENGLNSLIFKMQTLNFMEITKTPSLTTIPPQISKLINLTNLVLHSNQLLSVPSEIGSLTKLKYLDLSYNSITELPSTISLLINLQSLNVEFNKLQQLPDISKLVNLLVLKFGTNELTEFPKSLFSDDTSMMVHLSEIHAPNNQIADIPMKINKLSALKVFDLSGNAITIVPGQLGDCHKLKDINLKGNKVKDRRLQKLIDQCHPKQILDYIRSHCPRKDTGQGSNDTERPSRDVSHDRKAKVRDARRRRRSSSRSSQDGDAIPMDTMTLITVKEDEWFKVIVTPEILEMRKIVACIVRGVNLTVTGRVKRFLSLQTHLHSSICGNRQHATIATHDLSKISGNAINFDLRSPSRIKMLPLGRTKEMSAAELYKALNDEAEATRKEKKRNTYSGIHKYLYLLKGKQRYPCVFDANNVISFPPITNSECTKISDETKDLLLEVTGESIPTCKKVMDELLRQMLKFGIGNDANNDDDNVNDGDDVKDVDNSNATIVKSNDGTDHPIVKPKCLLIEPIKVVDSTGKLYVQYPSKVDLKYDDINIIRQKD